MAQNEISIQGKFKYRINGWKHSALLRLFLFIAFILLFYIFLADKLVSSTIYARPGTTLDKPIIAAKTIENPVATQNAKDEAAKKVQPVYTIVPMKNTDLVDEVFNKLQQVNSDDQVTIDEKVKIYKSELPMMFADYYDRFLRINDNLYSASLKAEMKKQLSEQTYRIPEEAYFKFPRLTQDEISQMIPVTKNIVERLTTDPIVDAETARAKVAELVNGSKLSSKNARELTQEIAKFAITPNKFYDDAATKAAQAKARTNTEPVYYQKGDIIVDKGQILSEDTYNMLVSMGMLKEQRDYWPQLGTALMVALLAFVLFLYLREHHESIYQNNSMLLMLLLIFTLEFIAIKVISLGQSFHYPYIGYLAPFAMGSMLISILLGPQIAYVSSILFTVAASVMLNLDGERLFDYRFGFVAAIVCFITVFAMNRQSQRSGVLKSGLLVSLFACLTLGAMELIEDQLDSTTLILSLSFAFAGGVVTAILSVGLLPFFEITFGILSPLKMVELSNPNHPLLRKLLTETPGSYHHSVMVGNLSEAAAEAIGANGLLCRVGSFYHDIGKTKRPGYFIENQMQGENPHDRIEPELSKSIIIAHARDGVEMLKEYKIPKPIRDIAEQHHGTTLLKYFYYKAKKLQEEHGGKEVREEDYHYPGPKAQTKEAAVVGIADCVEAAVRSMRSPTVEELDSMVRKIIKNRLDDNEFNECDLTMRELEIISKTLKETLLGIFHSRIEYPEETPAKAGTSSKGA